MIHHRERMAIAAVLLASLACVLPSPGAPAPDTGTPLPPVTPAVFLPPEWTPTPAFTMPELPPGWEEFTAAGAHLWLPESYAGGDMGAGFQEILDELKAQGPGFAESAQVIEQNPDVFVLWAFDTQLGAFGYVTNANITREDVPGGITPQEYLDAGLKLMPSGYEPVEQAVVRVGNYDAGKVVMRSNIQDRLGMSLMYSIRVGDRFWNVTYTTGADEYDQRLPIWEQSIQTFHVDG
jgi:hypothetical protein